MAIGDIILAQKFVDIRTKVNTILASGSGTSGYGQTMTSTNVSATQGINALEWDKLREDIDRAYQHQNGSTSTIVNVGQGDLIYWAYAVQYDTLADNITTNKDSVYTGATVGVYTEQVSSTDNSTTLGAGWGVNTANQRVATQQYNVVWSSADQARYFFNSGGYLRIFCSTGGTAVTTKDTGWQGVVANLNTQAYTFDAAKYRLGVAATQTIWSYTKTDTTNPYTENYGLIKFVFTNAFTIQVTVQLVDADAGDQTGIGPAVDETVAITVTAGLRRRQSKNAVVVETPTYTVPAWTLAA